MRPSEPRSLELHYMTGTGNSYRVARWVAETAESRDMAVSISAIGEDAPRSDGPTADLIGVLFPTHGFTAPWGVIRYVARMRGVRGRRAFVAASRAGWGWIRLRLPGFEGTGTWLVALMLAFKGAHVVGITGVDMPSNWTAVHPGMQPANVEDIIERAGFRVRAFAGTVLDGGTLYRGWVSLALGLPLVPVSLGYVIIARPLLGKLFIADERCTSCGVCEKSCPYSAIRMIGARKPKPYWTWDCESCMRCMNVCPENAIQAWQPGFVALGLLAAAGDALVAVLAEATGLFRFGAAGTLLGQLVSLSLLLGSWGLLYGLLWWLARDRTVAWLVGHTTFTRLYRRYREPGTDLRRV